MYAALLRLFLLHTSSFILHTSKGYYGFKFIIGV